MEQPKRNFGGRQIGAGRPVKPESEKLVPVTIFVAPSVATYLRLLPRADAVRIKQEAAKALASQFEKQEQNE